MPERGELFKTKLDKDQKSQIFHRYVHATQKERRTFARDVAPEYGVSRKTIQRIIRDDKRLQRYMDEKQRAFDLESAKMLDHLGDAVDVHIDIITHAQDYPVMYKTTVQNSANALMDRVGFKPKKDEDATTTIRFVVDPQMPKRGEREGGG